MSDFAQTCLTAGLGRKRIFKHFLLSVHVVECGLDERNNLLKIREFFGAMDDVLWDERISLVHKFVDMELGIHDSEIRVRMNLIARGDDPFVKRQALFRNKRRVEFEFLVDAMR